MTSCRTCLNDTVGLLMNANDDGCRVCLALSGYIRSHYPHLVEEFRQKVIQNHLARHPEQTPLTINA